MNTPMLENTALQAWQEQVTVCCNARLETEDQSWQRAAWYEDWVRHNDYVQLTPIRIIHSPYKERSQAPRQGRLSDNEITLEILPPFVAALKHIERCLHLIVRGVDALDRSPLLDIKAYAPSWIPSLEPPKPTSLQPRTIS
jgi:hypothetical protein